MFHVGIVCRCFILVIDILNNSMALLEEIKKYVEL